MRGPREFSIRAYVGGVLYLEGIIVLALGAILMFGYWPPFAQGEEARNPISLVGMVIFGVAVIYMFSVGLGLFLYNLLRPAVEEKVHPVRQRAWKYARMRPDAEYLFDETLESEQDADEAFVARMII
ncbi:MAG: hypothetical protein ACR2IE_17300 [Candidatus Sumerlaeaceae bacterium]